MTQYELSYLFQLGIDNLFDSGTLLLGATSAVFVAVHAARKSLNGFLVMGIVGIYTLVFGSQVISMLAVSDRLEKVAADVTTVAAQAGHNLVSTVSYSSDLWPNGSGYLTAITGIFLWASAVFFTVYTWRSGIEDGQ